MSAPVPGTALSVEMVQQDGSIFPLRIKDNPHNRQLQNFIARHESFALTKARQAIASATGEA